MAFWPKEANCYLESCLFSLVCNPPLPTVYSSCSVAFSCSARKVNPISCAVTRWVSSCASPPLVPGEGQVPLVASHRLISCFVYVALGGVRGTGADSTSKMQTNRPCAPTQSLSGPNRVGASCWYLVGDGNWKRRLEWLLCSRFGD